MVCGFESGGSSVPVSWGKSQKDFFTQRPKTKTTFRWRRCSAPKRSASVTVKYCVDWDSCRLALNSFGRHSTRWRKAPRVKTVKSSCGARGGGEVAHESGLKSGVTRRQTKSNTLNDSQPESTRSVQPGRHKLLLCVSVFHVFWG